MKMSIIVHRAKTERRLLSCGLWMISCSVFVAALVASNYLPAQTIIKSPITAQFIEKNCADCHDDETKKADLDLLDLPFQPTNEDNFALWVKVHDRVKAGEMPPKKKARPDPAELDAFVKSLGSDLRNAERAEIEKTGRAMMRRLNRYEYENTLRDLLDVPWVQIKDRLPEDGERISLQQDRRGARCLARAIIAIHELG